MRRYNAIILVCILLAGAVLADDVPKPETNPVPGAQSSLYGASLAQMDAPVPPAGASAAPQPERRRHLEQFRMLKLLELLDLSEDQEMEFLVSFQSTRDKHLLLQQERERLLTALADGLKEESINKDQVYELTEDVQQIKLRHFDVTIEFLEKVRGILSPAQFGRLVIFQERFEHELIEKLREFRQRRGPGMGGGIRNRQQHQDR